jgi:hypothetical protein
LTAQPQHEPTKSGTPPQSARSVTGRIPARGALPAGFPTRSSSNEPAPDAAQHRSPLAIGSRPGPDLAPANREPNCCTGEDPHHEWNAAVRNETGMQRLDRNYAEILQEIRVAQTGVQLLLAFLLSLAFTPRFDVLTPFDLGLYVTTLVLGAASAALLMAPACYHRVVFRQRLKRHLVQAANRFALAGLALLGVSLACAMLLILKIVLAQKLAFAVTAGIVLWFILWWYALPKWTALRHRG